MTVLSFLTGPLAGYEFEMPEAATIGRDLSNDIVLPDSTVSLVHCKLFSQNNRVFITDLGSTNGTYVNGKRIINTELIDGDMVLIGDSKIRIGLPEKPRQTSLLDKAAVEVVQPTAIQQTDTVIETEEELTGNIFGTVTYFLKRKIASGGMGAVYEAEQFGAEGFIKKVAIKTILPKYVQKSTFVSSFIGEAKLVANLVHQNIVQIHHLGRHGDGYYIAMEYIDGINLTEFISIHRRIDKKVPPEIATFIVARICRGLEYAHNKRDEAGKPLNLVHRDVCPNNIMISKEGEVKLTDFGVAKAAQFMEEHRNFLIGSVEYMSPEQASCESVDARSDIFSLGLVYYELLTGIRVFQCYNGDIDATLERVKKCVIPDPRQYRYDIPKGMVDILITCLQRLPDDRFQSAGELGYALEYQIYSKGYGPTIVTMAQYLNQLQKGSVIINGKQIKNK